MDEQRLKDICEAKLNNSLGWVGGRLSNERQLAMQYYRGDLFGNEQDGRSKVVSRDVAEAIDSVMPGLVKVFASTDTIIVAQPRRPEDEDVAQQTTDYLNWVFQTQDNAFDLLQTWIKDGLLAKLGVVKSWWEETKKADPEDYEGLTKFQVFSLLSEDGVELVSGKSRPQSPMISPEDAEALQQIGNQFIQRMMPQEAPQAPSGPMPGQLAPNPANFPAGQVPPGLQPAPTLPSGQTPQIPVTIAEAMQDDGLVYDVTIKRVMSRGHICIQAIPPEEFLTDRRAVSLENATFCAHRTRMTASELVEMGYPKEDVAKLTGGSELDFNTEVMTRFASEDEQPEREADNLDDSMRHVWVAECYAKVDFDGDGIAEWLKITLAGSGGYDILDYEPCEGHPFSAWTPNKIPHKLYGESLADKTMDLQLIKSTVWRQTLDGMYFNNAPQLVVLEGQANMEDVLTRRPGGVIRARSQGAVTPLPVQDVSEPGMQMINYLDGVREARTGVRRFTSATDADILNPYDGTATGAKLVDDASQDRIMLLARNFAEQGLKPLFNRLLELSIKYQDKPMTVRLRGKWVDIDPSSWTTKLDMTVAVGLGTGNRDRQVQQLMTLLGQVDQPIVQMQGGIKGPFITAQNIYAKLSKLVEAMGYKDGASFYTDPSTLPPEMQSGQQQQGQQQQPDPSAALAQAQVQSTLIQANAKREQILIQGQFDRQQQVTQAQFDAQLEVLKAQLKAALAQFQAALDAQNEQQARESQARIDMIMHMMERLAQPHPVVGAQPAVMH